MRDNPSHRFRDGQRLRKDRVLIEPGAPFFSGGEAPQNFYRLAYSSIPADRIEAGIDLVARAIASS